VGAKYLFGVERSPTLRAHRERRPPILVRVIAEVRSGQTSELAQETLAAIQALMRVSFDGDFSDDDWAHTIGGRHFFIEHSGVVVSHASVVPRVLEVSSQPFETGYVEGVATHPEHRRKGLASAVISAASAHVRATYEFGGLGTDVFGLYEPFGWERWRGATFVRRETGLFHSEDEDGYVMVLRFGPSLEVNLSDPISCEPRSGDDW
jgi:aminoglycoside 2'-N-acetyltransferase I